VEDDERIKNYFGAFHLHDTFPVSVVIDDFADFFDERYKVTGYYLILWFQTYSNFSLAIFESFEFTLS
jgi:hypothetical protein